MKFSLTLLSLTLSLLGLRAETEPTKSARSFNKGIEELGYEQDELAADVQQLSLEQTTPAVIELFTQVEDIMDETTDRFFEQNTGGETIAAQTEIIEKIHQAAKSRQSQQGRGEASEALMDMMERMMGKNDQASEKSGEGQKISKQKTEQEEPSPQAALTEKPSVEGKVEQRTVPRASGQDGQDLPIEFQKALEAYHRGLEKLTP